MSMKFSQRLELRQSQSLVMTPQLLQAIKLLQLSSVELNEYVETELEKNPLLERANDDAGANESSVTPAPDASPGSDTEWESKPLAPEAGEIDPRIETQLENVFQDDLPPTGSGSNEDSDQFGLSSTSWSGTSGGSFEDLDESDLEAYVAAKASLHDVLTEQLQVAVSDPVDRMIGATMIDLIDEAGYFTGVPEEIAERLGISLDRVMNVLTVIQDFEPTGVGARDLAECLKLQLIEENRFDPAMERLLANLELMAKRDFVSLRRICGVDEEDMAEMVADIRKLEPKPGLKFGRSQIQTVIPDVFVRKASDGSWLVELNSDALPRVLVNQTYAARVSSNLKSEADKAYISEALQTANWLTRSLEQRAKTILKVATEIVRHQDMFFSHGVEFLKPLNLRAVADAISMHESTVSRVTSNKYIAAERGVFEMKYFFTASISATLGGESHSAEAVRFRIKQLIDAEDPKNILSDDTIVQQLRSSGIDIARRTVAKYRESLRIPSSVERRREKQMNQTARAS